MQSLNILFTGTNQIDLVREGIPPLGEDEVLVQAATTLISTGTERTCLHRSFERGSHWDRWVTYPFAPGYSMVGRIIDVGGSTNAWRIGDRVALRRPHRQYAVASARSLYRIPDTISDDEAVWFALATIVQNGIRRAHHELGDCVVVIGLGLLGQLVVQYTRLLGARSIIAVDPTPWRLEMAKAHGATETVCLRIEDANKALNDLTDGSGADVVYDVTGSPSVLSNTLPLVKRFGKLVMLGDTGYPSKQSLTGDVVRRGLRIIGAHDSNPPPASSDHAYWSHQAMANVFFTYLSREDMRVSDLVTHRFGPLEAPLAYRILHEKPDPAMAVLLDWTKVEG